jgi:hypothetical protein
MEMESRPVASCVTSRIAETAHMPDKPAVTLNACIASLLTEAQRFHPMKWYMRAGRPPCHGKARQMSASHAYSLDRRCKRLTQSAQMCGKVRTGTGD